MALAESFARGRPAPPGVSDPLICVGVLFFILVIGPRRSLSLKLSDARVYEPHTRARLGTTAHFGVQASLFVSVEGGWGLGVWGSGVGLEVWGVGVRVWGSEVGHAGPSPGWGPTHLDESWGFIGHAAQMYRRSLDSSANKSVTRGVPFAVPAAGGALTGGNAQRLC